ncbi:Sec-independent protein translocase protein TatB [Glaciecola sp. XM2]|jgi:sec-independent protein translocase protein TatB|nr:Sec-independent protein translocase protein TatB [Glaciecola sp. XM2]MBT1449803.1 Sec-independent protein translocase protein TatB [Glaciecola sp. XM2]
MFDIGFWELLIIGIVALVVIGPERLPSFMRATADTIKSVKNMANGFKQEVSEQLKTHELHENLKKAEQMGMDNIGGDIKRSVDELKAAAASVQRPYQNQAVSDPNKQLNVDDAPASKAIEATDSTAKTPKDD